jgi:hypothetical protein
MTARRPLLFVLRQAIGAPLMWLGDKIEGDFRYECSAPDFDGRTRARRVPVSWQEEPQSLADLPQHLPVQPDDGTTWGHSEKTQKSGGQA